MKSAVAEQMQERSSGLETGLRQHLLLGRWINTNPSPAFLLGIQLRPRRNGLLMQVTAAEPGLPPHWGEIEAEPFAESPASGEAMALSAVFHLDGVDVRLQGYVVKGVLVIISFACVKDGRDRFSHFCKEFFYRVP